MRAAPGWPLQWWDEHRCSEVCRYASIPVARSLASFRTLRAANLDLVRGVSPRQLTACFGVHERRGRQTMRDFVVLEAAHDLNHLRQVAAILGRPQ